MDTPDSASDQGGSDRPDEGLSILDLASLSAAQLQVMRIILRDVAVSYEFLCASIDKLPVAERLSRTALNETLQELADKDWLLVIDVDADKVYKANLRRKSSRTVSDFVAPRSRRAGTSSSLRNIWDSIEKDDK